MSSDALHNPYKWHSPPTPLKMFKKIHIQKFHDKAVQSNILWLNLNKISEISILQLAHTQGNPSFHFHAPGSKRRYQCTQTASTVPKIFPLSAPVLYWLSHLTCISSLKAKNVDFHTDKNIQIQPTIFFSIFRRILINWPLTYILWCDHICGVKL